MINTLVVGATGATGRLLVEQLLNRGVNVRVIVRAAEKLPDAVKHHPNLSVIEATVLDLDDATLAEHVRGCDAVASCLGHNMNVRGMYGQPRRLVTDATRRLCVAVKANPPAGRVKFVLMNTAGNVNRDLPEPLSSAHKTMLGIIRVMLPPHADNEHAADYLRVQIGQHDDTIGWAAVRPDTLTNETAVTPYTTHPSPTRSALFNPGKTSRINTAHFMADLITDAETWNQWKGQMPVIYNAE